MKAARSDPPSPHPRRRFSLILATAVLLTAAPQCPAADDALEFWVHPYLPSTEILDRFTPLAGYLSRSVGRPMSVHVERTYETHLVRIGENQADIAFMGPAPFVMMEERFGPKPILGCLRVDGATTYRGVIVVQSDSPITTLPEVRGRSFAFGDPDSTMSHLVPCYMLAQAGVGIDSLSSYSHLKDHQSVALAVIGGYFDAGGLKEEIYEEYRPRGLRSIARSEPIPEHLVVCRSDLDPALVASLRKALLGLAGDPRGPGVLSAIKMGVTGFVPAKPEDYTFLRAVINGHEPHNRNGEGP